jgi:hypothetical protein
MAHPAPGGARLMADGKPSAAANSSIWLSVSLRRPISIELTRSGVSQANRTMIGVASMQIGSGVSSFAPPATDLHRLTDAGMAAVADLDRAGLFVAADRRPELALEIIGDHYCPALSC